MSLDSLGDKSLDYLPCRYGTSKLLFRGPHQDLNKPYVAFLGGTETYGKFVRHPFVAQINDALPVTCVNFGCLNAGVDVFLKDPYLPEAAHKSVLTVLQVPSAQNMSNRLYQVHPRRNDRFVAASSMLQAIFPDVDFAAFHFINHMLTHLKELSPDRFRIVEQEVCEAWKARMQVLSERVAGRILLVWLAERPVDAPELPGFAPSYVTPAMIAHMREYVTEYAEIVLSDAARREGGSGMVFNEMEGPAAREIMGPRGHAEVAEHLTPLISGML